MAPIISSNDKFISFDKFYSFFASKERFKASLRVVKKEINNNKSSARRCWFGQGSGHGCCGNYKGCCFIGT